MDVPDAVAVCFDAPVVEVLRESDLRRHPRLSALGPDLCSPDADLDEAVAQLQRLSPDTEIGVALLSRRVACGIGNVYMSEALFACAIDSFARLAELGSPAERELFETTSRMPRANLGGGRRATAPGGLAVYRKAGRPCPRCGSRIVSRRHGEAARSTYWCPSCQGRGADKIRT